jgi:hypothetical protein
MANKHYSVNEEIEVTLKFKVKLTNISNYHHLDELFLNAVANDFKDEITNHLADKIVNEYTEEVTHMCDWVGYEVIQIKE